MNWTSIYLCVECEKQLDFFQRDNDGVCPLCGHTVIGRRFCDTIQLTVKPTVPFWKFWQRQKYVGLKGTDTGWLTKARLHV